MRVKKSSGKNRFIAGLLTLIMVIGLLPAGVFATEEKQPVDAALFFSDLHTI